MKVLNREGRYTINGDKDMTYLFKQYNKLRIKDTNMFVEFLPIELKRAYLALPPVHREQTHPHPLVDTTDYSEDSDTNEPSYLLLSA